MKTPDTGAVAVVGARDGDLWTYLLFENLTRFGPGRPIWPVSRTRSEVRGLRTYPSLDALPGGPEVAVLAVSADQALPLVGQAVAAGVPHVVAISSGFAERGDEQGLALQQKLQDLVAGSGSRLYGPNGVGFADFTAGLCPLGAPVPADLQAGQVTVISQSGSVTTSVLAGLGEDGTGVDWCVSVGNGACFDVVDAIGTALARPATRVIAGYIESFGPDRARLEEVLARARDAGVAVVVLHSGRTAVGAEVTRSHTAAMTSSQRLVGEVLGRHGVHTVSDVETLVRASSLLAYQQRIDRGAAPPGGVAVIETSGGAAAVLADMMDEQGVRLARFAPPTLVGLQACAPPGAFVSNPIDLTASPKPFDEVTEAFRGVYRDPDVSWVMIPFALTFPSLDDGRKVHKVSLERYARLAAETGTKTVISTLTVHGWTDWARSFRAEHPELLVLRGVNATVRALSGLAGRDPAEAAEPADRGSAGAVVDGVPDPVAARSILQDAGAELPACRFVATGVVASLASDIAELALPVVVKLVAPGLVHKARVGGVAVGCRSASDAQRAAEEVLEAARSHGVDPSGVLVEEAVEGKELFVSFERDPWYGPFLLLAPGGGEVEKAASTQVVGLPASDDDLWRAAKTAERAWGLPVGNDAVVGLLSTLGRAFTHGPLRPWRTVELNPVILGHAGPRPVDVVLVPGESP